MRSALITAIVALAISLAFLAPPASDAASDVPTGSCNITAGGIGSGNNTANCNFGLTPEQFKQLTDTVVKGAAEAVGKGATEAAVEAAKKTQQEQINKISKTLGVTADAVKSLLKIVGEDPNVPEGKLADAVGRAADDYKRLQAQVAALNPDNPTAKALVEQAKPEIEAGHFQRAHELLHQATQAQIAAAQEARKLKEEANAAEDAQMLGAAQSTAAEGDVAMTERRYEEAAKLFGQAVDDVPSEHASEQGRYLMRQEDALYRQGDGLGDSGALRSAIEVCKRGLADYPRSEVPLEWAQTQNNLGVALGTLGEREGGTAKLEEAVQAFRSALEVWTRERVPLQWAMTQGNLGNALGALGERESDSARLEEAVAAYRAALEESTRERVPLDWAGTQNNLGNALTRLGERESGTARLEEAVAAYRAALEERTRERVPLQWAASQNNLGNALLVLGERESGTARLEEAVAADRAALEERTRERVPLDWAATQNNLGFALERLGKRESGTARLEEVVAAYHAALEERTRERVPLDWAASLAGQGVAMMLIADRTNNGPLAEAAVGQIRMAVETLHSGGQQQWATYFEARLTEAEAIRNLLKGK
jgi:tetratricopeptide (TPR) repeat protein